MCRCIVDLHKRGFNIGQVYCNSFNFFQQRHYYQDVNSMKTNPLIIALVLSIFLSCSPESNPQPDTDETDYNIVNNTDPDGNEYSSVAIGSQIWMTENLKTTKYSDGTDIESYIPSNGGAEAGTIGSYTWYNNDIANKDIYGALYNWYAVSSKKLCPGGWHVPSVMEWELLGEYLGGNKVAGAKIKETGTTTWLRNTTNTTNEYGFNGRPGGGVGADFVNLGAMCYWWTSTERDTATAYYKQLQYSYDWLMQDMSWKSSGRSVRCLKTQKPESGSNGRDLYLGSRILTYDACWLPLNTKDNLASIHIIFNDAQSPTGKTKLYFTVLFSPSCPQNTLEPHIRYAVTNNASCGIPSGSMYILNDSNVKAYSGEQWSVVSGEFLFSLIDYNRAQKKMHLVGKYSLLLKDLNGKLYLIQNATLDLSDSY